MGTSHAREHANAQDALRVPRAGVVGAIDSDGAAPGDSARPARKKLDRALNTVIDRATPVSRRRKGVGDNWQCGKADNSRRAAAAPAELGRAASGGVGRHDRCSRRGSIGGVHVLERGVRRWPRSAPAGIWCRSRRGRRRRGWFERFVRDTVTDGRSDRSHFACSASQIGASQPASALRSSTGTRKMRSDVARLIARVLWRDRRRPSASSSG